MAKKKNTRILSADELIEEIKEVLIQGDADFIVEIANKVLVPKVRKVGLMFIQEIA